MHFEIRTNSASECLAAFFNGLQASGTVLHGTNAQLTNMLVSALDLWSTHADAQKERIDADTLARDFEVLVESLIDDAGDEVYDTDEVAEEDD